MPIGDIKDKESRLNVLRIKHKGIIVENNKRQEVVEVVYTWQEQRGRGVMISFTYCIVPDPDLINRKICFYQMSFFET